MGQRHPVECSELRRHVARLLRGLPSHFGEAVRAQPGQLYGDADRIQGLVGADIRRCLLAADVLLSGPQGQHVGQTSLVICRGTHQPAGQAPGEFEMNLGSRVVLITAPGYGEYKKVLTVSPGIRYRIRAKLKRSVAVASKAAGSDLELEPLAKKSSRTRSDSVLLPGEICSLLVGSSLSFH